MTMLPLLLYINIFIAYQGIALHALDKIIVKSLDRVDGANRTLLKMCRVYSQTAFFTSPHELTRVSFSGILERF